MGQAISRIHCKQNVIIKKQILGQVRISRLSLAVAFTDKRHTNWGISADWRTGLLSQATITNCVLGKGIGNFQVRP
jgi:hypothetical protein